MADDSADPRYRRIKGFIVGHYSTRVHMSLILTCCGLTSMITSWFLLHYGVHSMLLRYPVAITMSYATFLIGVWTWLRATGLSSGAIPSEPAGARKAKSSLGDLIDIPNGSIGGGSGGGGGGGGGLGGVFRGGGGSFDGAGSSASFAEARVPLAVSVAQTDMANAAPVKSSSGSSSSSSWGSKTGSLFDGVDGDGVVLLILGGVLVAVVFGTSGYLIWCAPDVLTEAAFGAALTGTLSRPSAAHAAGGWVEGVLRKTCWPFAIVMVSALAFAGWCALHYPDASTFREAIAMAVHSNA